MSWLPSPDDTPPHKKLHASRATTAQVFDAAVRLTDRLLRKTYVYFQCMVCRQCMPDGCVPPALPTPPSPIIFPTLRFPNSPQYWRQLTGLAVTEPAVTKGPGVGKKRRAATTARLPPALSADISEQVRIEGAAVLKADQVGWEGKDWRKLATAVVHLLQYGWPPTFIIMFDEVGAGHEQKQQRQQSKVRNVDPGLWPLAAWVLGRMPPFGSPSARSQACMIQDAMDGCRQSLGGFVGWFSRCVQHVALFPHPFPLPP